MATCRSLMQAAARLSTVVPSSGRDPFGPSSAPSPLRGLTAAFAHSDTRLSRTTVWIALLYGLTSLHSGFELRTHGPTRLAGIAPDAVRAPPFGKHGRLQLQPSFETELRSAVGSVHVPMNGTSFTLSYEPADLNPCTFGRLSPVRYHRTGLHPHLLGGCPT